MATSAATRSKPPKALLVAGVLVVLALIAAAIYLARTPASTTSDATASAEAKAYLPNLQLTDVSMKATENFMKQQVLEIEGKITNKGPRPLEGVEIYCYFSGVDGRTVYRERVPIVQAKGAALKPGEVRNFRLPFDSLPDTWNQALPHMVIAQITFAR
ncbi:MAG: hypothetical protein JO051_12655 [Acidobacteriaceae bacterium]|nr:hypothetical protein [Acidobacteriaceae bacterium]